MIDKVTRMGALYDVYGSLLTDRQRQMVELHYLDDWSLAEIAERFSVTRQAVHDNLKRAEEQMEAYEQAIGVVDHNATEQQWLTEVLSAWSSIKHYVPDTEQDRMRRLLTAAVLRIGLPEGGDELA